MTDEPRSIPGVCDVLRFCGPAGAAGAPRLLIEVPHGATRRRDFDALRARLRSPLPDDLAEFFHVNTDVGAPECARAAAEELVAGDAAASVVVVRGRIPRTFVDTNRALELGAGEDLKIGLTPALPEYVRDAADVELLSALYRQYQTEAARAFELVCGGGGLALILHTYAPRSVEVERVDGNIVAQLRAAYEPGRYARWKRRPDVDLITEDAEGRCLAPADLIEEVARRYAALGLEVAHNATYRLHPSTMGQRHGAEHPGRVLTLELNRALLVERFTPFEEMQVDPDSARRLARPLAAACRASLARRPPS